MMRFRNECANCCQQFVNGLIIREIIIENPTPSPSSKGKFEGKVVKVNKVLSSVYKLDYLNQIPYPQQQRKQNDDGEDNIILGQTHDEEVAVCDLCAKSLTILYKCHEELSGRRKKNSFLAKKIQKLEGIFDEIQATWSQMVDDNLGTTTTFDDDDDIEFISEIRGDGVEINTNNIPKSTRVENTNVSLPGPSTATTTRLSKSPMKILPTATNGNSPIKNGPLNKDIENFENNLMEIRVDLDAIGVDADADPWTPSEPDQDQDEEEELEEEEDQDPLDFDRGYQADGNNCSLCKNSYLTPGDLVDHLCSTHLSNSKTCPLCQKKLNNATYLKPHLNSHIGYRPYQCPVEGCPIAYSAPSNLSRHIKVLHPNAPPRRSVGLKKSIPSTSSSSFQATSNLSETNCSVCGKQYLNLTDLTNHMYTTHTLENPLRCPICEKTLLSRGPLKVHIHSHFTSNKIQHKGPSPTRPLTGQKKKAKSNSALGRTLHRIIVGKTVKKTKHVCPTCLRNCQSSFALQTHLRTHTGEKPFVCTLCDYAAAQATNLKLHIGRVHDGKQ